METAVIRFNDGTQVEATLNGNCYITETKPDFPADLRNITITVDGNETVIDYGRIVEPYALGSGYWFIIEAIPESERNSTQVRADVDFIAMELDIDL